MVNHDATLTTGLKMAAHGRCSASHNRPHDLLLVRIGSMPGTISFPMAIDNLCQLQLVRRSRLGAHGSHADQLQIIQW